MAMTTFLQGRESARRSGFTLVELLVALGVVSLMMLLFAEVFQIATGTMTTQRGIMENDQRARALSTIITNDLRNRSMRTVIPFQPGEQDYPVGGYYSFSQRQGFLSISENDPNNDADDVLHFTTRISAQSSGDTSLRDELYYGRATMLDPLQANQPELDDGAMFANSTATSNTAEIVYFLRNGNLYRRVLLIRQPLTEALDAQPTAILPGGAQDFFDFVNNPSNYSYVYAQGRDFWRDFDFSARYRANGAGFTGGGNPGTNALDNAGGAGAFPIANPLYRFGHNPVPDPTHGNGSPPTGSIGNPREYVGPLFIGRFTHEETSNSNFNYPHSASADELSGVPGTVYGTLGIPTDPIDTPAGVFTDNNTNNVIDQFERGPRRGEDILLSNVHSFDVKVWDEVIGDYVDVGHSLSDGGGNPIGDFNQIRNRRITYGPQMTNNRVFDTWHPKFNANGQTYYGSEVDSADLPPFVPRTNPSIPRWQASTLYNIGDTVIPSDFQYDTLFYYQCAATNTGTPSGRSGMTEPTPWPAASGAAVGDNEITWTTVYNPAGIFAVKRLRSLKITIRYLDVTSDQMRQLTLIRSLMD